MRIATWNVNSLKARLEKVVWWLERAKPDVLLMQETKLADADAPRETFQQAGYELAHHGEGRWNGVAIVSRVGIADVISNFGQPPRGHARLGAGAARLRQALRVGTGRRLPAAAPRVQEVHLVGLSGRQLPQEPGNAHRPPARHEIGRRAHGPGRDRPRSPEGQ